MKIYADSSRRSLVEDCLYENNKYYIDFEGALSGAIENELKKAKLTQFITWQPGNQYASLKVTNFIGNVYLFGKTYDVKSQKFLHDLKGTEQFQAILDEIQKLSKNVIFTYHSPSFSIRQIDYSDTAPSVLLVFNYFKNIILDWPISTNLRTEFEKILRNPHFKYATEYKTDKIEKLKKVNHKVLKSLVSNNKDYVKLSDSHEHLLHLPVVDLISPNESDRYFPTKVTMQKKHLSYDTDENRFIKFFFEYVGMIAFQVSKLKGIPKEVLAQANQISSFTTSILQESFFDEVGKIRTIPAYSTVLQSRAGYKDIFSHFMQSKFGVKHVFDEFSKQAMSIDLKRVSEIYEYLVFYKIALSLLGEDITVEQQEAVLKDGELVYSVCFKHNNIKVYYNWTASKARRTAYSVELRPDVAVCIDTGDKIIRLLFDAKYKVQPVVRNNEIVDYSVKSEDIQKMHTYLDAIENADFSVVVYPGREFKFYEKTISNPVRKDVASVSSLQGVGAIPLIPSDREIEDQFDTFIQLIKDRYSIR